MAPDNKSVVIKTMMRRFQISDPTAPNITPDKETGIGAWKREEITDWLITGTKPDLDYVRRLMYDVIQGMSHATAI